MIVGSMKNPAADLSGSPPISVVVPFVVLTLASWPSEVTPQRLTSQQQACPELVPSAGCDFPLATSQLTGAD